MTTAQVRVAKVESRLGPDEEPRRLRAMSDEQLAAEIAVLQGRIIDMADQRGIVREGRSTAEVCAILNECERIEANGETPDISTFDMHGLLIDFNRKFGEWA